MKNDMMSAHLWEERQQESVCLRKSREETLEEGLERRECLQQKNKKKKTHEKPSIRTKVSTIIRVGLEKGC